MLVLIPPLFQIYIFYLGALFYVFVLPAPPYNIAEAAIFEDMLCQAPPTRLVLLPALKIYAIGLLIDYVKVAAKPRLDVFIFFFEFGVREFEREPKAADVTSLANFLEQDLILSF